MAAPRLQIVTLALPLTQTNARSPAVLRDELDPCLLQNALDRFKVVRYRNGSASLEIPDSTFAHIRLGGEIGLREFDQSPRGSALRRCHLNDTKADNDFQQGGWITFDISGYNDYRFV